MGTERSGEEGEEEEEEDKEAEEEGWWMLRSGRSICAGDGASLLLFFC